MKSEERRTKEMAVRVVLYSDRHADADAGHIVLVGKLKGVVEQLEQEEAVQRNALLDRHTSSLEKQRVERELKEGPIATIVRAAALGRNDEPGLASQLRYRPNGTTYDGHLVAARALLEEARANKEVLARYGASDAILGVYQDLVGQFETAVKLGNEARAAHKGATSHLDVLAREARGIVRTMDARNRIRFKNDAKLLGEWVSASAIFAGRPGAGSQPEESPAGEPAQGSSSAPSQGSTQGGTPAAGGDVRPAA
jgi:hypothetical protein